MNWFYRKSVCTVVTTVFTAVQVLAYAPAASADVITDYAAQGSQYGKDSRNWFLNNLPSLNGKTMTIKGQNGQTVTIDNTDNMAGSQNASSSRFPVETTAQGMEDLKSMAGDYKTQQDTAAERKNYVMGMIQKLVQGDSDAQVTIENTVYSLIDDLASSKQPDYSEDVMWQMTRSILENLTEHAEDLATCDSETTSVTKDVLVHKPNEVTCQQVLDRTGECELTHDYEVLPVISIAEGASANILSCGRGCTQTWLGRVGDNYLDGGSCSLFNFDIYYRVNIPDAIVKIELDYAKFDDQIELYLGPKGSEEFILRMPLDTFPYDYDGTRNGNRCELSTSWVWDPTGLSSRDSKYPSGARVGKYTAPIDVTKYF